MPVTTILAAAKAGPAPAFASLAADEVSSRGVVVLESAPSASVRAQALEHLAGLDGPVRFVRGSAASEPACAIVRALGTPYVHLGRTSTRFAPDKLTRVLRQLERSTAAACFSNSVVEGDGSGEGDGGHDLARWDCTLLSRFEHIHALARGKPVLSVDGLVCSTDLYLRLAAGGVDPFLDEAGFLTHLLVSGEAVFLGDLLQTVAARPASSAAPVGAWRALKTPAALNVVQRIFSDQSSEPPPPEARLWFLGQQFAHRASPDERRFGLDCLRGALEQHGDKLRPLVSSVIGGSPWEYVEQLGAAPASPSLQVEVVPPSETALSLEAAPPEPGPPEPAALPSQRLKVAPGETPSVAVVVTCYSNERFFQEAVASIEAQTYSNVVPVFHDNGCSPSYSALITSEAERIGGLIFRTEINRYGEGLRYDVLPHLETDFTAILHDDDYYEPTKIEDGIRQILDGDLDYIFTERRHVHANRAPFAEEYEEVNTRPFLPGDFPYQHLADTYYRGLRLHFSTLIMATWLAKQNLMGDPYLPRITDSLFMQRLLLDETLRGDAVEGKLTNVRVHGENDMLYSKFAEDERAREFHLLQFAEYFLFQELVDTADDEQLRLVFAKFPGVATPDDEPRHRVLVRAALDLRNWFSSKPLMGAYCVHAAWLLDARATLDSVRELSPEAGGGPFVDANQLTKGLYRAYAENTAEMLSRPRLTEAAESASAAIESVREELRAERAARERQETQLRIALGPEAWTSSAPGAQDDAQAVLEVARRVARGLYVPEDRLREARAQHASVEDITQAIAADVSGDSGIDPSELQCAAWVAQTARDCHAVLWPGRRPRLVSPRLRLASPDAERQPSEAGTWWTEPGAEARILLPLLDDAAEPAIVETENLYPTERSPDDVAWRWSGPGTDAILRVPLLVEGEFEIRFSLHYPGHPRLEDVTVRVNDNPTGAVRLIPDEGHTLAVTGVGTGEFMMVISITAPEMFSPGPDDARMLGLALSRVEVRI